MNVPHRGGHGGRSRAGCMGVILAVEEEIAPRKRAGLEFLCGTCECAAEVIIWMGMLSRKSRTAAAQDGCDLLSRCSTLKQFFGDPLVGDAPVGLWEALQNPQSVQPTGIDLGRDTGRRETRRAGVCGRRQSEAWRLRQARWVAQTVLGRLEQSGALGSQAGVGVQHLHPRRVTAPVAPLWFLIGEAGQAAQMTPIGTGRVAAVEVGQLFADLAGNGSLDGCGTDLYPSLEIAGAGLEYHTRLVTSGPHGFNDGYASVIEIDEDVARIALLGVRMDVDIAALPVANAQEPDGGWMGQLGCGPQPLTGKCPSGLALNQTDEIEVVKQGRQLPADGLHSEIESAVEHGPNCGVERTGRTMNSQRTANSGLTGCLSLGVHRKVILVTESARSVANPRIQCSRRAVIQREIGLTVSIKIVRFHKVITGTPE